MKRLHILCLVRVLQSESYLLALQLGCLEHVLDTYIAIDLMNPNFTSGFMILTTHLGGIFIVHQECKVAIMAQVDGAELSKSKDVHHQTNDHVAGEATVIERYLLIRSIPCLLKLTSL